MSDSLMKAIRMMQDTDAIERDIEDVLGMMRDMFFKKYIRNFERALEECHQEARNNPTKEVYAMQAFKHLVPEDQHDMIDKIIDMLVFVDIIQTVRSPQKYYNPVGIQNTDSPLKYMTEGLERMQAETPQKAEDASIHPDGVYDIDIQCVRKMHDKL